jgi:hypothetical protein
MGQRPALAKVSEALAKRKRDFSLGKPTALQEQSGKKKRRLAPFEMTGMAAERQTRIQGEIAVVAVVNQPQDMAMGFTARRHRVTVFSRTAILAPGGWASD